MTKTYRAPNNAFSLTIPDNWDYSAESHSVAIYDPFGVGALNVSTLLPPKGVQPRAESIILNLVSKSALEDGIVNVITPQEVDATKRCAYVEYQELTDIWRYWVFTSDFVVVAISYNCKLGSHGIEDAIVDKIVSSIEILDGNS